MNQTAGEQLNLVRVAITPPGVSVRLEDDGTGGDLVAGDSIYSAELTSSGAVYPFDATGTYEAIADVQFSIQRKPALSTPFVSASTS